MPNTKLNASLPAFVSQNTNSGDASAATTDRPGTAGASDRLASPGRSVAARRPVGTADALRFPSSSTGGQALNVPRLMRTALDHYHSGNLRLCLRSLSEVIEKNRNTPDAIPDMAYAVRGDVYRRLNQFTRALADLNRAVEKLPEWPNVWVGRGLAAWALGAEQALADSDRVLQDMGLHPTALALNGLAKCDVEGAEAGFEAVEDALSLDDLEGMAHVAKGYLLFQQGLVTDALTSFNDAAGLDANDLLARDFAALMKSMLGQEKEALSDLAGSLKASPQDAFALAFTSKLLLDRGSLPDAEAYAKRVVRAEPAFIWGLCAKAAAELALGKDDAAEATLNDIIARDLNNCDARFRRGQLHAKRGNWESALGDLNMAQQTAPSSPDILTARGWAYHKTNNDLHAIRDLEHALDLQKNRNIKACEHLVQIYRSQNNALEAHRYARLAQKVQTEALFTFLTLGYVKMQQGKYSEAIEALDRYLADVVNNAEAYLLRGNAYLKLKRYDDAEENFLAANSGARTMNEAVAGLAIVKTHKAKAEDDKKDSDLSISEELLRTKDFAKAADVLDHFLKKGPHGKAFVLRGEAKIGLQLFSQAVTDFNRALALDDQNSRAMAGWWTARLAQPAWAWGTVESVGKRLGDDIEATAKFMGDAGGELINSFVTKTARAFMGHNTVKVATTEAVEKAIPDQVERRVNEMFAGDLGKELDEAIKKALNLKGIKSENEVKS